MGQVTLTSIWQDVQDLSNGMRTVFREDHPNGPDYFPYGAVAKISRNVERLPGLVESVSQLEQLAQELRLTLQLVSQRDLPDIRDGIGQLTRSVTETLAPMAQESRETQQFLPTVREDAVDTRATVVQSGQEVTEALAALSARVDGLETKLDALLARP